ncbi:MAG: flavin reductase family protein [Actinomycetota bacterium]|nr:flavin reductase family protein [Actinomycetota bacterium]
MPIDASELRRVMGHFATGVTVVTSMLDGRPCAMTANSVASVSLSPPLVMFCPDNESETRRGVEQSGFFAINILEEGSERISRDFSARGPKIWDGIGFHAEETGAPVFEDSLAWVDCSVFAQYPGGDHLIVVGEILRADAHAHGNPLLFYRGGYHTLGS